MHFYLQKVTIGILSFRLMKKQTTSKLCMLYRVKNAANLSFGEGTAVMTLGKSTCRLKVSLVKALVKLGT